VADHPDLAALRANPARVTEVPAEGIIALLTAAAEEHEQLGAVERALLARLTGNTTGAMLTPAPKRSRALWLRVAQVAEEYGVKPATVYDWIYQRRVTTKKLGASKRAPVLLYRPDVEKLATVRRALRRVLDAPVVDLLESARGADQAGAEGARGQFG